MSCQHCVKSVTSALEAVNGTSAVSVDLDSKTARVEFDPTHATEEDLFSAVVTAGYTPVKKN